jgi:hypothetical protein
LASESDEAISARLDAVYSDVDSEVDPALAAAQQRAVSSNW